MEQNEEQTKINTTLEDNIINIPFADTVLKQVDEQQSQIVTPIPEVQVKEQEIEKTNNNPMVEKNIEDDKVTSKSLAPLIMLFTIFIISIIGLPYIDDLIALINPPIEEELIPFQPDNTIIPTPTPIATPTASPTTVPAEIIDNLTQ